MLTTWRTGTFLDPMGFDDIFGEQFDEPDFELYSEELGERRTPRIHDILCLKKTPGV